MPGVRRQRCEVPNFVLLTDPAAKILGVELHWHARELVTVSDRSYFGLKIMPR